MIDVELIREIARIKKEKKYTLYDMSRILDVQIATIERWLKTNRINKVYANLVKEKLDIK